MILSIKLFISTTDAYNPEMSNYIECTRQYIFKRLPERLPGIQIAPISTSHKPVGKQTTWTLSMDSSSQCKAQISPTSPRHREYKRPDGISKGH